MYYQDTQNFNEFYFRDPQPTTPPPEPPVVAPTITPAMLIDQPHAFAADVMAQGNELIFRQKLFDLPFDVPEVKMSWENCEGWTWFLCPSTTEPFKKCKKTYTYPCWKAMRRTTKYSFYLVVHIPATTVGNYQQQIKQCHDNAVNLARDFIQRAAIAGAAGAVLAGNPAQAPFAALQEASKAFRPATKYYLQLMQLCAERFGVKLQTSRLYVDRVSQSTNWS
ncbi:twin-arginine translocation signal domain-containing protein [Bacillus cereus]|uniref:twin-arginine translocation signal domain-containing protein n=1 Tax=Bacillus cereus TaxID=1396 RepID=UPI0018796CE4|nr:twin-arginine translocation signal domain-containing protein [Bacillus cereus]MBE7097335.1 twin-arginine translocation signal domain-containing protein [Bacillus cereus]